MNIEKKYWLPGMLNADDADFRIGPDQYINNQDFRVGTTSDKGFAMQLESNGSTLEIPNTSLPTFGENITIGTAMDYPNRRMVYFIWNSFSIHGIYLYDYKTNAIALLLTNSQVEGGLGWDKDKLIHSARIENNVVYWTDNIMPRKLNIQDALELNIPLVPDPPGFVRNTTNLPVSHIDPTGGVLGLPGWSWWTWTLPGDPFPGYGSQGNLIPFVTRLGTAGPDIGPTTFPVGMNWAAYPTRSAGQIIVDGFITFFQTFATGGGNTAAFATPSTVTVYIKNTWDWDLGAMVTFPPTVSLDMYLNYFVRADGTIPMPYLAPISQSVLAWIRRQPAFPPNVVKSPGGPGISSLLTREAFRFAYRYQYKDYEFSTLSGQSLLINYGTVNLDTSGAIIYDGNTITITLPFGESIDQDVLQVDLVAFYLKSNVAAVIKSWNKTIIADDAAITNHNAMTVPLTYLFTNNQVGITIDAAYAVKPFDSVPLLAQTLEFAKNRAFFGNYTLGYNTPLFSSLAVTQDSVNNTNPVLVTAQIVVVDLAAFGSTPATQNFYLFLPGLGYYRWASVISIPPILLDYPALTFIASDNTGFQAYLTTTYGVIFLDYFFNGDTRLITNAPPAPVNGSFNMLKSAASYRVAITFYDFAGRKCGYYTNDTLRITTPERDAALSSYIKGLIWSLSNTNAAQEIPVWAVTYSVNISLCLRTRFFIQSRATSAIYASKDANGVYTYTVTTYQPGLAGVAIDISYLNQQGMGYSFTEGDKLKIYTTAVPILNGLELNIIAQDGIYVICQLTNLGTLAGFGIDWLYEIYTPYAPPTTEPEYEVGQFYSIVNPATDSRTYSQLTGELNGDVYIIQRKYFKFPGPVSTVYLTEAMNVADAFYTNWFTNDGRPNFLDSIGQVTKRSSIAWSNTLISGSHTNGLSTFDALDVMDISPDFGDIIKLQLASKVQKIGTIMLAICNGAETASMYLSENTLISQTGESVVAQANAVIGSVHQLKGEFGTLNPESVIEYRGNVYWWDIQNGKVIQYADNGLFPVSNYKINRFAKLFSDQYKSMTAAQIEALGNRPFIFVGIDPHHGEVLFTIPKTLATPPRGFLPDYPSVPFPFDIWDGLGKTMVYKLYEEPNKWQGSYSFQPEYMAYLEDNLFSFKHGKLYLHNQLNAPYCNYYGVQYSPSIMCVANQQVNKPKSYNNFSVEGNAIPNLAYFMSLYEYLQSSDLAVTDFQNKEGIFYAPILRNKLDPAFSNHYPQALISGEKMRTTALYIWSQWDATVGLVQIKYLNVGYTLSLGQKV